MVDTIGVLSADRTNVGVMSVPYLRSDLPGEGRYLAVAYGSGAPAPLTSSDPTAISGPAGRVRSEQDDLQDGVVRVTVVAHRDAAVVLSASFDPGWTARVDGRRVATEMLAPALVGVSVPPGVHDIVFRYVGFAYYPELLAVLVLSLAALVWTCVVVGDRRKERHRAAPAVEEDRVGSAG